MYTDEVEGKGGNVYGACSFRLIRPSGKEIGGVFVEGIG